MTSMLDNAQSQKKDCKKVTTMTHVFLDLNEELVMVFYFMKEDN